MSKIFYRPMFRTGGSSNSGITSGLRQGYDPGGSVGKRVVDVRQQMADAGIKARDPKQNFWNFLMSSGLDLASRSPQGNILQTAAASARDHLPTMLAGIRADKDYEDKLNLSAFDMIRAEDEAEKDFKQKKELIKYEADVNPKLKKVFREEIPEVMINEESKVYLENEHDVISSQARQIAKDVVTFELFRKDNPEDPINEKQFIGVLRYGYGKKGESVPNYSNIAVGQIFYNPEDNYFYERISDKTGTVADFKALDPFTYD
jgi:hypothetical protein